MPKWISVEKAVIKYHIEKEAILLWVEMGQFPMLYIDNVPNVDEECILELFRRSKAGITAEYIDTLEQLCIDKTMVCEKYAHIIQLKEKEIQLQKEINTLINEIQAAMKRQNERIRDLKKAIGENNNVIRSDSWIKGCAQKVSMVNNYQCTNYHVGHYCTVFTTEDKESRPLPFAAYSHSLHSFLLNSSISSLKPIFRQ